MNVLVVSGIWPPDPGGPASHAPALADFLRGRGHTVEVVTTADRAPEPRDYRGYLGVARAAAGRAARGRGPGDRSTREKE